MSNVNRKKHSYQIINIEILPTFDETCEYQNANIKTILYPIQSLVYSSKLKFGNKLFDKDKIRIKLWT